MEVATALEEVLEALVVLLLLLAEPGRDVFVPDAAELVAVAVARLVDVVMKEDVLTQLHDVSE